MSESANFRSERERLLTGKTLSFADPKLKEKYLNYREMLNAYKLARGCSKCGYNEHPAALDLDHEDQNEKTQRLATMFTYSREKIRAELDKCIVLCANCHRIKTFEAGENGPRQVVIINTEPEWTLFDLADMAASVRVI